MKKYFLMLVMLFTMSVYSFAEDTTATEIERIERYDLRINLRKLGLFLNLSTEQMGCLETVETEFQNDLMSAALECDDNKRKTLTKDAINKHIKHMYYFLNEKQYEQYLALLNITIKNRGFVDQK